LDHVSRLSVIFVFVISQLTHSEYWPDSFEICMYRTFMVIIGFNGLVLAHLPVAVLVLLYALNSSTMDVTTMHFVLTIICSTAAFAQILLAAATVYGRRKAAGDIFQQDAAMSDGMVPLDDAIVSSDN
jgi:hypothetical protein